MKAPLLVLILAVCCFQGCGETPPVVEPEPTEAPDVTPSEEEKHASPISILDNTEDPEIAQWIESHKITPGAYEWIVGGERRLLISGGQKPAGHSVVVDEVSIIENQWTIDFTIVEGTTPQAHDPEYPYALIVMANDDMTLRVRDVTGEPVEVPVKAAGPSFLITSPLSGALVESPITISGRARVGGGTFRVILEDGHTILGRTGSVTARGGPHWGDFSLSLEFTQPANPHGAIIFYTEDPEEGLMEEFIMPVRFK